MINKKGKIKLIKTIFWDFDGVILDFGFAKIFEEFDKELFHNKIYKLT